MGENLIESLQQVKSPEELESFFQSFDAPALSFQNLKQFQTITETIEVDEKIVSNAKIRRRYIYQHI